jgi:hypothetical protein
MAPDLDTASIRTLQQHLNTLGISDHHGRALPITGHYDDATRIAVSNFQQQQKLPSTGLADPATSALIEARATITELQQVTHERVAPSLEAPLREGPAHVPASPSVSAQSLSPVPSTLPEPAIAPPAYADDTHQQLSIMQAQMREIQRQMEAMNHQREQERTKEREQDHARTAPYEPAPHAAHPSHAAPAVDGMGHNAPAVAQKAPELSGTDGIDPRQATHPLNGLYNELKTRIPDASDKRLLQFTAACHTHHITAENLGRIDLHEQGDYIRFCPSWPPGPVATVDLKTPAPEPQQCMAHIQQHDQQQVQLMAQIQAQVALTNAQGMQGPVQSGPSL